MSAVEPAVVEIRVLPSGSLCSFSVLSSNGSRWQLSGLQDRQTALRVFGYICGRQAKAGTGQIIIRRKSDRFEARVVFGHPASPG